MFSFVCKHVSIMSKRKETYITMKLTEEEFNQELSYLVSKQIINDLLKHGYLTSEEYCSIKKALLDHYKPLISTFLED